MLWNSESFIIFFMVIIAFSFLLMVSYWTIQLLLSSSSMVHSQYCFTIVCICVSSVQSLDKHDL